MNRLYNVISSYEEIGFSLVFRRINEGNSIFIIYGTSLVRGNKRLYLTSRLREVRSPRKNSPRETELRIFSEMARIWENSCKDFPLNRCYVFFLQEKMPKRSVGIVPKIFFV